MQRPHFAVIQLSTALLCAGVLLSLSTERAEAYNCGVSWTHDRNRPCEAMVNYSATPDMPEFFGVFTDVTEPVMSCRASDRCFGYIENEIRLLDDHSPGCVLNHAHACWIEIGTMVAGNFGDPQIFAARATPASTPGNDTYDEIFFGDASPPGTVDQFNIVKTEYAPTDYNVWVFRRSAGVGTGRYLTNAMSPNTLSMGQGLAGGAGAQATNATFTRNDFAVVPVSLPPAIPVRHPQRTAGTVVSASPPFAIWTVRPGAFPGSGVLTTHCCNP